MIAVVGGSVVPCAPYATFGSEELSTVTTQTLGRGNACLMANHGMIAVETSLSMALKVASEVELLAEQYWRALQVGEPYVLDDAQMAKVMDRFRTYGQQKSRAESWSRGRGG